MGAPALRFAAVLEQEPGIRISQAWIQSAIIDMYDMYPVVLAPVYNFFPQTSGMVL
jgi:hypothetical protein